MDWKFCGRKQPWLTVADTIPWKWPGENNRFPEWKSVSWSRFEPGTSFYSLSLFSLLNRRIIPNHITQLTRNQGTNRRSRKQRIFRWNTVNEIKKNSWNSQLPGQKDRAPAYRQRIWCVTPSDLLNCLVATIDSSGAMVQWWLAREHRRTAKKIRLQYHFVNQETQRQLADVA